MEPPKNWGTRILEFAIAIAVSGFLIKLGVDFIICVWKPLLIIAGITMAIIVGYRLFRHYRDSGNWRDDNDHF